MYEGKLEEVTKILDVTRDAMVESFDVPFRDRYQLVYEHKKYQMIMEDTELEPMILYLFKLSQEAEQKNKSRHSTQILQNHWKNNGIKPTI